MYGNSQERITTIWKRWSNDFQRMPTNGVDEWKHSRTSHDLLLPLIENSHHTEWTTANANLQQQQNPTNSKQCPNKLPANAKFSCTLGQFVIVWRRLKSLTKSVETAYIAVMLNVFSALILLMQMARHISMSLCQINGVQKYYSTWLLTDRFCKSKVEIYRWREAYYMDEKNLTTCTDSHSNLLSK